MQKIFYLLVLFISTGIVSNAQIKKGNWLLGGDVSVNTLSQSQPGANSYTSGQTSIGFAPSLGKAIRDNLILGFDLAYAHNEVKNVDFTSATNISKADAYGAGIFLREYQAVGKGFAFFGQERLGGSYSQYHTNGSLVETSYNLSFGFSPGLAYSVCRKVQFEASLPNLFSINYNHDKSEMDNGTGNSFSAGTHFNNLLSSVEFGFRFILGS